MSTTSIETLIIWPKGITYNPYPRALRDWVDPGGFVTWSLSYFWKMDVSEFLEWVLGVSWVSQSFRKKGVNGRYLPFDLFWLLKTELEFSVSNQMRTVWSFYEHHFHNNHIRSQGITYKAWPRALRDFVDPGVFVTWSLNNFWKIAIWKFLSDWFEENKLWRGASWPPISFGS